MTIKYNSIAELVRAAQNIEVQRDELRKRILNELDDIRNDIECGNVLTGHHIRCDLEQIIKNEVKELEKLEALKRSMNKPAEIMLEVDDD